MKPPQLSQRMSFRELRNFCEIMRSLGYHRLVSMVTWLRRNFTSSPHRVCPSLDPSIATWDAALATLDKPIFATDTVMAHPRTTSAAWSALGKGFGQFLPHAPNSRDSCAASSVLMIFKELRTSSLLLTFLIGFCTGLNLDAPFQMTSVLPRNGNACLCFAGCVQESCLEMHT